MALLCVKLLKGRSEDGIFNITAPIVAFTDKNDEIEARSVPGGGVGELLLSVIVVD